VAGLRHWSASRRYDPFLIVTLAGTVDRSNSFGEHSPVSPRQIELTRQRQRWRVFCSSMFSSGTLASWRGCGGGWEIRLENSKMRKMLVALAVTSTIFGGSMAYSQTATTTAREVYIKAQPTDVLSSNLIGLNVQNNAKDNVGEIKDLVVSNGSLSGLILSVGGFLGIGERYVVVAPSAVKVVYSENDKKWSATMDTTKDALKAAPEFKYEGRWKR
jgi:hypothetical protein